MKGYNPHMSCKINIELSSKKPVIELGVEKKKCECGDNICEFNDDNTNLTE